MQDMRVYKDETSIMDGCIYRSEYTHTKSSTKQQGGD